MNKYTRKGLLGALCVAFGLVAGVALTQPAASNWRAQDGTWNIGYLFNIKSGGTQTVESGGTLSASSGSTASLGGYVKVTGAAAALAVTVNQGETSAVVSGLSLVDSSYGVFLEPTGSLTNTSVGSKTSSGFTLSCATASTTTTARALIVHY